jgi:lipopolysaccharide/colanic/teichoic acid biosynthesis glycosyltransferase
VAKAVVALLSPALLAALVVTQTFGSNGRVEVNERALGVAVAAVALTLRAPVLLAVALAVVTTALGRAFL